MAFSEGESQKMFMKKYRRTKIGRKMIEILCVLTIPMLIICLLMTSNSKNTLEDEIINNYKNLLKAASDQMSDRFRSIELLTVSLTLDDDLNKMCIVSDTQKGLVLYNAFQQRLYAYAACQQIDCNLSVWLPQQNRILSSQDYIYIPSDAQALMDAMPEYAQWAVRPKVSGIGQCLSISTGYVHPRQSNPIFFVEIDESNFLSSMAALLNSPNIADVFLVDHGTNALVGNGGAVYDGQRLLEEVPLEMLFSEVEPAPITAHYQQDNMHYRVLICRLYGSDCAIGILLRDSAFAGTNRMIYAWVIAIVGVFFIIVLLFMFITYRQIVSPVDDICETMRRMGAGDFSQKVQVKTNSEIGDIGNRLNQTSEQLQTLIRERYDNRLLIAQSQMRILQSQINPHFLYNCLFTLYNYIMSEDLESAANMTLYLGQYYQMNVHPDGDVISLERELEHIRLLVKIQTMRFCDQLGYTEEIEEPLKQLRIPNLTLLTVTENFLIHGFKQTDSKVQLTISAHQTAHEIILTTADTGTGMSEEKLRWEQSALESATASQEEIHGLQNILLRFRDLYGAQSQLVLKPNTPHGLIVEIHLPLKEE